MNLNELIEERDQLMIELQYSQGTIEKWDRLRKITKEIKKFGTF